MAEKILIDYYKTPAGELILGSYKEKLCLCDWRYRKMRHSIDRRIKYGLKADFQHGDSSVIAEAKVQLEEYFKGERKEFTLPVQTIGSHFQQHVWAALRLVKYGETKSYLALAQGINNSKAVRAVASANGANALSIIIPCHRIIGTDGKLTGYAGGLKAKKWLIELEANNC